MKFDVLYTPCATSAHMHSVHNARLCAGLHPTPSCAPTSQDKLDDSLLKKIGKFTVNPDFTPDTIGKVSGAARGLCLWVRAMETYGHVSKEVAPKRAKLKGAQDSLSKKQAALKAAQDRLAEVRGQGESDAERGLHGVKNAVLCHSRRHRTSWQRCVGRGKRNVFEHGI